MVEWDVGQLCVCFLLGGFTGGGDDGGFFFFFGMGGRFVVVVVQEVGFWWVMGFVMTIGSVVVGGVKNSWIEKNRDKGERDREREEE